MKTAPTVAEAIRINERLKQLYGKFVDTENPRYRVVFSDDEIEKRHGTFNVTTEGGVFLREETGIREVPKYEWLQGQWVLERLLPNMHKEVYEGEYTYEPLYAFPPGLPIKWEAIHFVCQIAEGAIKNESELPKTEKQAWEEIERQKAKDSARILNMLDNTAVQSALHDGGAVSLAGIEVPKNG